MLRSNTKNFSENSLFFLENCQIRKPKLRGAAHAAPCRGRNLAILATLVDISSNKLTSLPESVCDTLRLKIINISDNKLENLPENFGNQQLLDEINCSNNEITELPKDLRKKFSTIKKFNFSKNYIKFVDKSLHHLQQLEELDLNSNQISRVQLPASRHLKCLRLGGNSGLETEKLIQRLPSSTARF